MVAGVEDVAIGETISDLVEPRALPPIRIDEPTVAMTFAVNTSPWAGREGDYVTSRKLSERIDQEARRTRAQRLRLRRAGPHRLQQLLQARRNIRRQTAED